MFSLPCPAKNIYAFSETPGMCIVDFTLGQKYLAHHGAQLAPSLQKKPKTTAF